VTCPTLIVHGEQDKVVKVDDSKALFEMCQAKTMLYISSIAGHNNLGYISSLFVPIATFFMEFFDKKIPLPKRKHIDSIFAKRKYSDVKHKNFKPKLKGILFQRTSREVIITPSGDSK